MHDDNEYFDPQVFLDHQAGSITTSQGSGIVTTIFSAADNMNYMIGSRYFLLRNNIIIITILQKVQINGPGGFT